MLKLVLIRHGESVWNRENKFTGWTNVPLSDKGVQEAKDAGKLLKEKGFNFKLAYTSYLNRAIKTLWLVLEEMDLMWIPVYNTWRLNEKHYGNLQGLNKAEMAEKFGDEQVLLWRRSYDAPPPPIPLDDPRHPSHDQRYAGLNPEDIPATEALKDTEERIVPYWKSDISKSLQEHKEILVAAHGNSLRGIVKYLKDMGEDEILKFNIPTGIPYVFEFDDNMNLQKDYFIGDPEEIKKLMDAVANQAKKK
ncbi:MAG TPA: 2,3-diphosphoglycerate-dependent phosphoglycerate mutase [Bacteroidales bacterium]|nr:2,3-diphosphoglycerate-dependent phosphoglycerate mutase [Bacteroidales bacterium]HRX97284.1 2,3-diphosphoglycerate-dependent phosphoglycerate mutase [Bacteroidales bacterium]